MCHSENEISSRLLNLSDFQGQYSIAEGCFVLLHLLQEVLIQTATWTHMRYMLLLGLNHSEESCKSCNCCSTCLHLLIDIYWFLGSWCEPFWGIWHNQGKIYQKTQGSWEDRWWSNCCQSRFYLSVSLSPLSLYACVWICLLTCTCVCGWLFGHKSISSS